MLRDYATASPAVLPLFCWSYKNILFEECQLVIQFVCFLLLLLYCMHAGLHGIEVVADMHIHKIVLGNCL